MQILHREIFLSKRVHKTYNKKSQKRINDKRIYGKMIKMNKKQIIEFYTKKIDEVSKLLLKETDEKKKNALLEIKEIYQNIMDREG